MGEFAKDIERLPGQRDDDDLLNLGIVRNGLGQVLLGRKTRGFGADQLVLPGGKERFWIGPGSIARRPNGFDWFREVEEETGLRLNPATARQVAQLTIDDGVEPRVTKVFRASTRSAEVRPSREFSELFWRDAEHLPYEDMPADYPLWLPHLMEGYEQLTSFIELDSGEVIHHTTYGKLPGHSNQLVELNI